MQVCQFGSYYSSLHSYALAQRNAVRITGGVSRRSLLDWNVSRDIPTTPPQSTSRGTYLTALMPAAVWDGTVSIPDIEPSTPMGSVASGEDIDLGAFRLRSPSETETASTSLAAVVLVKAPSLILRESL